MKLYIAIAVLLFSYSTYVYCYRTDDATIKIGDKVVVPVGDKEVNGTVVFVGEYLKYRSTISDRANEVYH